MERDEYHRSSSRLDVQRHRLDDKRDQYAHMNARVKIERERRLGVWLWMMAWSVVDWLAAHGHHDAPEPTRRPLLAADAVEGAESARSR